MNFYIITMLIIVGIWGAVLLIGAIKMEIENKALEQLEKEIELIKTLKELEEKPTKKVAKTSKKATKKVKEEN